MHKLMFGIFSVCLLFVSVADRIVYAGDNDSPEGSEQIVVKIEDPEIYTIDSSILRLQPPPNSINTGIQLPINKNSNKKHKCDQCDYATTRSSNLTTHKLTHTGEKPFKCDQCDYATTQLGALTKHKRTHTGEKPFKCDQCDYATTQLGHLNTHKRNKHPE